MSLQHARVFQTPKNAYLWPYRLARHSHSFHPTTMREEDRRKPSEELRALELLISVYSCPELRVCPVAHCRVHWPSVSLGPKQLAVRFVP